MKYAFLALALAAGPVAAQDNLTDRPAIVVVGRGQAEQAPDTFRAWGELEGRGSTQVEALRAVAEIQDRLTRDIERLDGLVQARVANTAPSVGPLYDPQCVADRPNDRQNCAVSGYVARMNVTMEASPADRAGNAVSLMAERGATNARLDSTYLANDRDLQIQARQAAFADARRQADALAQASSQRLGRILRIQEPGAASSPPPPPSRPEVVVTGARIQPAVPLDFKPPPVRVDARLTVVFEIE